MSTPKVNTTARKFWINNPISPINSSGNLSDSDKSSNEEFRSVRSSLSKESIENLPHNQINAVLQKTYKANNPSITKNSCSNMDHLQLRSNGGPLLKKSTTKSEKTRSVSNLALMGQQLKSSYTSLKKPICTNLPVAPPPIISDLNVTKTFLRTKKFGSSQNIDSNSKIVEVSFLLDQDNSILSK